MLARSALALLHQWVHFYLELVKGRHSTYFTPLYCLLFHSLSHLRLDYKPIYIYRERERESSIHLHFQLHRGKRRALPNARIMIHQPLGGAQGQAADIEIQAKEILYIRACLNAYIADYTNQPVSKVGYYLCEIN